MPFKKKLTPHEREHIYGAVATFRCGLDGCGWSQTTRLDTWLVLRAAHRANKHPDFRPAKVKSYPTPPRTMTRREMEAGIAA